MYKRQATDNAYIFEVTSSNETVWEYNFGSGNAFIARAQKYPTYYLNGIFSEYNIGDINFDGNHSLMDILIITEMLLGNNYLPTPPADLNQNGIVDQEDVHILINNLINWYLDCNPFIENDMFTAFMTYLLIVSENCAGFKTFLHIFIWSIIIAFILVNKGLKWNEKN